MPIKLKGQVYKTIIRPVLLYDSETWPLLERHKQELRVTEMKMLRWMCGVSRKDRVRNVHIRAKSICVLLAVGFVAANDLKGVDPNTLSCDPEGQVFLLLPHFTDCNKYYMCAHGKEVEFTCSSTTIFDFELQTCNWNWATKCWLRGEPTIEGSGDDSWTPEEASGSFDIGAAAEDEHKFRPDLKCNVASSASRRVSYKGDCQRYWHCRGADLTVAYCSDGLFFNAQTQQCDHEANVQCKVQQEDELKGEFIVYKK